MQTLGELYLAYKARVAKKEQQIERLIWQLDIQQRFVTACVTGDYKTFVAEQSVLKTIHSELMNAFREDLALRTKMKRITKAVTIYGVHRLHSDASHRQRVALLQSIRNAARVGRGSTGATSSSV